jgi:phosphoribosylaminoimidazole-succinocarboxamide synthase
MEEGKVLEYPVVEMYFKDKKKQLLMINEYHAYALGLCERKEMTNILRIATKVNAVLKSFFDRRKMKLIGFRLEFGRSHSQIVVADEVSLDTMDLWLVNPDGSFEKLPDSRDMSIEAYADLRNRILG